MKNIILITMILIIMILPFSILISANVILNNGTILNSSVSNSSITFTGVTPVYADDITILQSEILLTNVSYTSSGRDINITLLNYSLTNSILDSLNFPKVVSAATAQVLINSSVNNVLNMTINKITSGSCSLLSSMFFTSAINNYTTNYAVGSWTCDANSNLTLSLYQLEQSISKSNELNLTYLNVPQQAGGSQGALTSTGTQNINETKLCESTFRYIKKYSNFDFTHLDEVKKEMSDIGINVTNTKVMDFVISWRPFCSDLISKTLEENYVCNKIYYFKIGNENNYTDVELEVLRKSLESYVPISLKTLKAYSENYNYICYPITNLKLPFKDSNALTSLVSDIADTLNINQILNPPKCSPNFNSTLLDLYIPFFKISLGETDCSKIDNLRFLFKIKSYDSINYSIIGLRLTLLWIAIFGFALFLLIRISVQGTQYLIRRFSKK